MTPTLAPLASADAVVSRWPARDAYIAHVMDCPSGDPRRCWDCWGLERDASAESWQRASALAARATGGSAP